MYSLVVRLYLWIVDHYKFVVFDVISLRVSGKYSFFVGFSFKMKQIIHSTINITRKNRSLNVLLRLLIKSMELIDRFVQSGQLIGSHKQSDFLAHIKPESKNFLCDSAEDLQLEHLLSRWQNRTYHQANYLSFSNC